MYNNQDTQAMLGAPDREREPLRANAPLMPDGDKALAALRRQLLVYGTAGQVARMRAERLSC
jgi:hypothetical protein